jgi:hypothetical protein
VTRWVALSPTDHHVATASDPLKMAASSWAGIAALNATLPLTTFGLTDLIRVSAPES